MTSVYNMLDHICAAHMGSLIDDRMFRASRDVICTSDDRPEYADSAYMVITSTLENTDAVRHTLQEELAQ